MINLPEWVNNHDAYCGDDFCSGKCLYYEALLIAWEALEQTNIEIAHSGNFIRTTKRLTVFSVQDRVVSAMRQIEELGK